MVDPDQFGLFVGSRLLSGIFGAVPSAVGGGIILDVFFLHHRGRAFACYEVAIIFGATSGPTFSGFITGSADWTICFWWTVGLLSIAAILVLMLAEESDFDRERSVMRYYTPKGVFRRQVALFFPGSAKARGSSVMGFVSSSYP